MKFSIPTVAVALCSAALAQQPSILPAGVQNVSSAQPILAPNVVFVIYGSNLGPSTIVQAPPPYETPLAETSVTFTPVAGGDPISPPLYFTLSNAVVGVLPSLTAPGSYSVRVTYRNQTSSPQKVTVVPRHFGIAAANGLGSGVAQATIANVNGGYSLTRFTSSSTPGGASFVNTPAHRSDAITLWGTGGGADSANDAGGSSGDQSANFKIILAGQTIVPAYAGAVAGFPGLWVINFTVPDDATPDCFTTVQVNTGGELSNTVTVPIAPTGENACTDPLLSTAQLARLDAGGEVIGGGFSVTKLTTTAVSTMFGQPYSQNSSTESVGGGFGRYNSAEYATRYGQRSAPPCIVYETTANPALITPGLPHGYLNAGESVPVAGPSVAGGMAMTPVAGTPSVTLYNLNLRSGTLRGGTYSVTGKGGPDIGAFTASVGFPSPLSVADWDNIFSINRNQPYTINWNGGGDEDIVITLFGQTTVSGSPADPATQVVRAVSVVCRTDASAQTLTIPASLTALVPGANLDPSSGTLGTLTVVATSRVSSNFTAPLAAGGQLDFGFWTYSLGVSRNISLN